MVTLEQIKELRTRSGAGVNVVKEALEASNGDVEEAIKYLRKKGVAKSEKRKDKVALNGVLGTYIHSNNRMVAVVEVACETDFAAKSPDVIKFANDLALHIAAVNPIFVSVEDVSEEAKNEIKETAEKELEGKPIEVKEKIIEGKLQKFFDENVLLNQKLFTDETKTVKDYLDELVAKIGEKTEITRFVKISVAEVASKCNI
jgi:elongation factor Ts